MNNASWRTALFERQQWLVFLLPFLVFMLVGALEPTPTHSGGQAVGLAIPYALYPWVYTAKIVLTLTAIVFVVPGYRQFPFRVSRLALLVGVIGAPLWIGLCLLDWERDYVLPLLERCGLGCIFGGGDRSAYNPLEQLGGQPALTWAFLAVRFFGLAVLVPILEEFFLRGFVMRFFMDKQWWKVPFGKADKLAIVLGTAVPMLSHPELLAALVWFSMITWLMLRTKNIWDCVAAHALTNFLLGVYVVSSGNWRLW